MYVYITLLYVVLPLQGTTMYDGPAGAALLSKWSSFFKSFRALLSTGDVIHVRRPNGQDIDIILHAKAGAAVPGLLAIFNPTDAPVQSATLTIPLYYTGITGTAVLTFEPWPTATTAAAADTHDFSAYTGIPLPLDWRSRVSIENVTVPPRGVRWATLMQG